VYALAPTERQMTIRAGAGEGVYVILEIEYPRLGFIRVDSFDSALVELRDIMK